VINNILKKGASMTDNVIILTTLCSDKYIPRLVEKLQVSDNDVVFPTTTILWDILNFVIKNEEIDTTNYMDDNQMFPMDEEQQSIELEIEPFARSLAE
jgi:hypothetical protein